MRYIPSRRFSYSLSAQGDHQPFASTRQGFVHALYQNVLYGRLPASRRVQLHRRIGERGEEVYGERAKEIAGELAMHFERGRDYKRAAKYLSRRQTMPFAGLLTRRRSHSRVAESSCSESCLRRPSCIVLKGNCYANPLKPQNAKSWELRAPSAWPTSIKVRTRSRRRESVWRECLMDSRKDSTPQT